MLPNKQNPLKLIVSQAGNCGRGGFKLPPPYKSCQCMYHGHTCTSAMDCRVKNVPIQRETPWSRHGEEPSAGSHPPLQKELTEIGRKSDTCVSLVLFFCGSQYTFTLNVFQLKVCFVLAALGYHKPLTAQKPAFNHVVRLQPRIWFLRINSLWA